MEIKYQLFMCSFFSCLFVVSSKYTTDQPIEDFTTNDQRFPTTVDPDHKLLQDIKSAHAQGADISHPIAPSSTPRTAANSGSNTPSQDDEPMEEVEEHHVAVREMPLAVVAGALGRQHQLAAQHVLDNNTWTHLSMALNQVGHAVKVDWEFHSNESRITGFVVCYRMSEREDYDSSKLDLSVRAFTLHSLHQDEEYEICVHVMINTTVIKEVCGRWSEASKKTIVGVAVGCLFLVPMTAVMIWFYAKDKKIRKKYAHLYVKETKEDIETKKEKPQTVKVEIKDQSPKVTSGHHHDHHHHHDNAQPISKGQCDSKASAPGSEPRAVYINAGSDENLDT